MSNVAVASEISLERRFGIGLARAFGGAIIFALPMIMSMEMWWLGVYTHRGRLALLLALSIPLLVRLSFYAGFEETFDWKNDVVDAFVALAVGFFASGALLWMLGILETATSFDARLGMIAIQCVPASIGAMLAQSLLGRSDEERREHVGYFGELFLMMIGALFLAFNLAPTEEMILIAYKIGHGLALTLAAVSLLLMHAFVYAVEFRGQHTPPEGSTLAKAFVHYTVVGYAIALVISGYVLWTFGRLDGSGVHEALTAVMVLAFPASVGASAARLIL